MKKCELCNSVARMYCESDRAILCWDCDARVHAANFLVAKHARTLLCHACQSPTAWSGSGPKLEPTVSVCEDCVHNNRKSDHDYYDDGHHEEENGNDNDDEIKTDTEDDDDDDDSDDSDGEDGRNDQVVPLSFSPRPPVSGSSSSEESSWGFSFRRSTGNPHL